MQHYHQTMTSNRHRWGNPPNRPTIYLTIRTCIKCGMKKQTHHQGNEHWTTFEKADGTKLKSEGLVPFCTTGDASGETSQ